MKEKRLFIYPNEVERITGLHSRSVCRLFTKIKKKYGIRKWGNVPVEVFCEYTLLSEEKIRELLEK